MIKMDSLTKTDQETLLAIIVYMANHGYPPTVDDIKQMLGFSSKDSAYKRMLALEKKHVIRWDNHKPRAIVVLCSE